MPGTVPGLAVSPLPEQTALAARSDRGILRRVIGGPRAHRSQGRCETRQAAQSDPRTPEPASGNALAFSPGGARQRLPERRAAGAGPATARTIRRHFAADA